MTTRARVTACLPLVALVALVPLLPACGDAPPAPRAHRETVESWAALKSYGDDQREAFLLDVNARMATLDRQLDELKARSARATADVKADIERELTGLQSKRGALADTLAALEQSSKAAWAASRDAAVEAFESLTDGINAAATKFAQ